jgi:hypothetical protein
MVPMDDGYLFVNLGFNFTYLTKTYTQVCISSNGYVCMGANSLCGQTSRPTSQDILVGLNYDLDTRRPGSGQIYYQDVSSDSSDFKLAKDYVNLLNSMFVPSNVFMITYDNVLHFNTGLWNQTKFQIFLLSDNIKSYVIFQYITCPSDLKVLAKSGLNYEYVGKTKEIIIEDSQQCNSSNVLRAGIWVSEVTESSLGNFSQLFYGKSLIFPLG